MNLYSNFTVKDWLASLQLAETINNIFRNALKDNDEPMAVLTFIELVKRGDIDSILNSIKDATDAGNFASDPRFSMTFALVLAEYKDHYPIFGTISTNAREKLIKKGSWPKTSDELLDGVNLCYAQSAAQTSDDRLNCFLDSFMQKGWFSIKFGLISGSAESDSYCEEQISNELLKTFNLVIKDGSILNGEVIPYILGLLDVLGISNPLPVLNGHECRIYGLGVDKVGWIDLTSTEEVDETFFCVTYHPVGRR